MISRGALVCTHPTLLDHADVRWKQFVSSQSHHKLTPLCLTKSRPGWPADQNDPLLFLSPSHPPGIEKLGETLTNHDESLRLNREDTLGVISKHTSWSECHIQKPTNVRNVDQHTVFLKSSNCPEPWTAPTKSLVSRRVLCRFFMPKFSTKSLNAEVLQNGAARLSRITTVRSNH